MDETVVLTASTAEVQEFLIKHKDTDGAYRDPLVLSRKRNAD